MQSRIQKWGNSLAVRIPKSFAEQSKLKQNVLIDILVDKTGKIVIQPIKKKKTYTLEELMKGMTKKNLHGEIDFGKSLGKETLEYE